MEARLAAPPQPAEPESPPLVSLLEPITTVTPAELSPKQRIVWRIVIGLLFTYAMTLFVPWEPVLPPVELDASWYMILHWAFLKGLDFGTEVVFTYGPWGFIFQGYHPSTFIYTLIGWTLITCVCFIGLLRLSERVSARRWVQALWLFAILALSGNTVRGMHDMRVFLTCWTILLVHFHVDDRPLSKLKTAMVLALALISLGKFSLAVVAFMVVVFMSIDMLARRVVPWVAYIYLAALAALWLAAGQSPVSILPFLINSFKLASGYAEGVGIRSAYEGLYVFLFILCALGFLGVVGSAYVRRIMGVAQIDNNWKSRKSILWIVRSALALLALVMALFLTFKIGYVRHDEHELLATTFISVLALLYLAVFLPRVRVGALRTSLIALPCVCLLLTWFSFHVWVQEGLFWAVGQSVWEFPHRTFYAARSLVSRKAQNEAYEAILAQHRQFRPLPKVEGTVDGFSWIQYALLSYGMDYDPRPAFQGYLGYVPDAARMNADFLSSTRAPDSVLVDVQYIDSWYPSTAEAASWPELLGKYVLKDASTSALLLERYKGTRQQSRVVLQEKTSKLGDWIEVPQSNEPIWVSLNLKPTFAGGIAKAIYRPPMVSIIVKTADGAMTQGRLIPSIAREGFLLSPLVLDRTSLAVLWSDQWRDLLSKSVVTQFRVVVNESDTSSYAYDSEFAVKFQELRYEHQDILKVPGIIETFRFQQFAEAVQPMGNAQKFITKNELWHQVLLSPAPTRWIMDVPQGVTAMRVTFGMLQESYMLEPMSRGVQFRVYAATLLENDQIRADPLWSRALDPAKTMEDRGPQTVDIQFPAQIPKKIVLETAPGAVEVQNPSYWSDLVFH